MGLFGFLQKKHEGIQQKYEDGRKAALFAEELKSEKAATTWIDDIFDEAAAVCDDFIRRLHARHPDEDRCYPRLVFGSGSTSDTEDGKHKAVVMMEYVCTKESIDVLEKVASRDAIANAYPVLDAKEMLYADNPWHVWNISQLEYLAQALAGTLSRYYREIGYEIDDRSVTRIDLHFPQQAHPSE